MGELVRLPDSARLGDDGELMFVRFPVDDGVIPPPVPAAAHLSEDTTNFQYGSRLQRGPNRSTERSGPSGKAFTKGYVLSAPATISFRESGDARQIVHQTKFDENYVERISGPESRSSPSSGTGSGTVYFRLKLYWTVDAAEDYSLFCHQPFFTDPDHYQVLPSVFEPSVGKTWIYCELEVSDPCKLRYGEPLLQVVPVESSGLRLDAVVEAN